MTETTNVASAVATIDTYLDAYGEPDAEAPRRVDPRAAGRRTAGWSILRSTPRPGTPSLATLFGLVQTHYPNHTFRRVTGVDQHRDFTRYGWEP